MAGSSSQITLTWTASTDNVGVTGYRVERCQGPACTTFAQVATPTATTFSDTGLAASTSYSYRVRAADAAGNLSAYSSNASATTMSASSDTQAPTAPANLTATGGGNQITLNWTASTDNVGVTTYRVEQCLGAGCTTFTEIGTASAGGGSSISGPLTASANPNYFKDASGTPIILNGSHTWNNLQDWGSNGTLQTLDFPAFVNFLVAHGHNFTLLWRTELPKFCGFPTIGQRSRPDFTVGPQPWQRTGPGNATDGAMKFDLTKFDQAYFDRLRARTQALNAAGIYAGVYLFTGEWLGGFRCATDGYPFTGANNVNGINDGGGTGSITMTAPNAITAFQDAFVEKVIDTLNDLPNVLWIVSEEAPASTRGGTITRSRMSGPTSPASPCSTRSATAWLIGFDDTSLNNSIADFVNPNAALSPTTSCGTGTPRCKVNINDSDHSMLRHVERHGPAEPELCLGEFHEREPGHVHGSLRRVLPARGPQRVSLPDERHLHRAGSPVGQLPGQSRVHPDVLAQAESCERHAAQLALFHQQLSGADAGDRGRVPDLRAQRRHVHRQPLGDVEHADA